MPVQDGLFLSPPPPPMLLCLPCCLKAADPIDARRRSVGYIMPSCSIIEGRQMVTRSLGSESFALFTAHEISHR